MSVLRHLFLILCSLIISGIIEALVFFISYIVACVSSLFVAAHALLEETLGKTSFSASHLPAGSIATECENINVLVTSGSLIPSLAKCLLYRLDDVISAKNSMYSVICFLFYFFHMDLVYVLFFCTSLLWKITMLQ